MVCIYCQQSTNVSNSRLQKRNNTVWRRRVCTACRQIFTTVERAELNTAIVVLGDQVTEPLDRDALLVAIYESCKHRPSALHDAIGLTATAISDITKKTASNGTISAHALHDTVRAVLQRFDPAAATIYSAYHH
jgi:transcriptional repressor NrdR